MGHYLDLERHVLISFKVKVTGCGYEDRSLDLVSGWAGEISAAFFIQPIFDKPRF